MKKAKQKPKQPKKYPPNSPYYTRFGLSVDFSIEGRGRLRQRGQA